MDTMFTETNRTDLSVKEVINLYSKQWQIESNFKTLKGKMYLFVPMYCINMKAIIVRLQICLCFISLVFLNYIILHSKY